MKIGLALSGGGALGAAHIGALEEIEKNGIAIDSICGTSSGAIIGLLYSHGGTAAIDLFFAKMKEAGLFNKTKIILKRNSSIFQSIEELLKSVVDAKDFSDLNISFSCVASDIVTGKTKVFSRGNPIKAVLASSAYPGVFPVQNIDNHYYVDGGVVKNLPASVLKDQKMDFIIGSSLYKIDNYEKVDGSGEFKANPLSLAIRALEIMEKQLAKYEEDSCDFCFEPPVHDFRWYDFGAIEEIREVGRKNAAKNIFKLKISLASINTGKSLIERIFR